MKLPTGTVTFLFTDIEGSTRLLQRLGDGYRAAQDDHARILRQAIDEGGGVAIRTEGDSFFAVFADHAAAVRAAVTAQRALAAHQWPHARRCSSGWASTPGAAARRRLPRHRRQPGCSDRGGRARRASSPLRGHPVPRQARPPRRGPPSAPCWRTR
jgi:hypothetical protein